MVVATPNSVRRGQGRPKPDQLKQLEKGASSGASDSEDEEAPNEKQRLISPLGAKTPISWLSLFASKSFIAGAAYTCSSISMILLNKLVLSGFGFDAPNALMFFQNSIAVIIVGTLSGLGLVHTERITWRLVRIWLPVNLIFVGMLLSGFNSLKYMQVAMVTILKNTTNILTAVGDTLFFGKRHNRATWGSLGLVILSGVVGGITDLSFNPLGYMWQVINCFFTAGYSLYLRKAMDTAKAATKSGTLNEYSMVMLNNLLSLPLILVLVCLTDEVSRLRASPLLVVPSFWVAAFFSGLLGLSISFSSLWFLHQTSPTTYSLVGSLNKIPLSVMGIWFFNAPTTWPNLGSIAVGLLAGILFTRAKMMG
ncbi:GDP-mannose transporter [Klebsormidium nitens]|uniref:GDP-mannose transporter n=1 Tax=Klebsormidium nitens TaxID=105231 RepID=A0A1Y1I0R0_KLENI|nr:GDP-mannose transporter [Klebsormidium nitens]|eukprot:GAQ82356.1 GDP-mannose transporter [Klebsormidium nitens]